jgi:hypothetical protein
MLPKNEGVNFAKSKILMSMSESGDPVSFQSSSIFMQVLCNFEGGLLAIRHVLRNVRELSKSYKDKIFLNDIIFIINSQLIQLFPKMQPFKKTIE